MKTLMVCATYGRLPYLGRMLSSFTNQVYDDKHLVIINDDKNVDLCCDRKDVTIINCNTRVSVPHKRNMGISIGDYDLILPIDDDDVFLPNRLSNHTSKYSDPTITAYRNLESYIIYGNSFRRSDAATHNSISYKQKEWKRVGGYYHDGYQCEDITFHDDLKGLKIERNTKERDFVYGFGGVNYHLSCEPQEIYSLEGKASDQLEMLAYKQLERLDLVGKKFWIEPNDDEYNKIIKLSRYYETYQTEIPIKHLGDAKIDISHLPPIYNMVS